MRGARVAVVGLLALVLLGAGAVARFRRQRTAAGVIVAPEIRAPDSVRVRVQVLNATKTRGLARRATMLLRDRGFDVVEMGTTGEARDSTLVIDLSGHPEWANRVAKLFGTAKVESRPDSSRYLDVAVVLGATWRPPAVPFYP